eukprot:UN06625
MPDWYQKSIYWGRQWAVMSDGEQHKTLRKAFPKEFMVYDLSRNRNTEYLSKAIDNLLEDILIREQYKSVKSIDMMEDIAAPLALELLCLVLGFKKATPEFKENMRFWAHRSADTGGVHDTYHNAQLYIEGHEVFLKILDDVERSLKTGDETKYDHSALMARP